MIAASSWGSASKGRAKNSISATTGRRHDGVLIGHEKHEKHERHERGEYGGERVGKEKTCGLVVPSWPNFFGVRLCGRRVGGGWRGRRRRGLFGGGFRGW